MSNSPGQDFVYGFLVPEDFEEDIYNLAKQLELDYAFSGDAAYGTFNEKVVGFALNKFKTVDNGYLGGYYGNRFDVDYFNQWVDDSKQKMTPDLIQKIKETFGIDADELASVWTLSYCG